MRIRQNCVATCAKRAVTVCAAVSKDEGRSWAFKRYLEHDTPGPDAGSYSYPSIIQTGDGMIHVTYSYKANKANLARQGLGENICHAWFDEAWLLARDGRVTR